MSKQKIPDGVRYALFNAYGQKCPACPKYFPNLDDVVVDHIIEESILKKPMNERLNRFKSLGLDENFDVRSLYNLRPLCRHCNETKSNNDYGDEIVGRSIQEAKNKYRLVNKYLSEYNKRSEDMLRLDSLTAASKKGTNLEQLIDAAKNKAPFFSQKLEIYENDRSITILNKSVSLYGFFLKLKESNGTCLFKFKSHYIQEADITLDNHQILEQLYPGMKTPREFKMRNYVKSYLPEYNSYVVQLGNSQIYLKPKEVDDLCETIDLFIGKYINSILAIQKNFESEGYQPVSNALTEYRLITVDYRTWKIIESFTSHYDYHNAPERNSVWNCFDFSSENMIKVWDREKNVHKCFIKARPTENHRVTNQLFVDLDWWYVDIFPYSKNKIGENDYWSVDYARNWLVNKLIPQSLFWYTSKHKKNKPLFKNVKHDEYLLEKYRQQINDYVYQRNYFSIKIEMFQTYKRVSQVLYELGEHFQKYNSIEITKELVQNSVNALKNILKNSKLHVDNSQIKCLNEEKQDFERLVKLIKTDDDHDGLYILKGVELKQILNYESTLFDIIEAGDNEIGICQDFLEDLKPIIDLYNRDISIKNILRLN